MNVRYLMGARDLQGIQRHEVLAGAGEMKLISLTSVFSGSLISFAYREGQDRINRVIIDINNPSTQVVDPDNSGLGVLRFSEARSLSKNIFVKGDFSSGNEYDALDRELKGCGI